MNKTGDDWEDRWGELGSIVVYVNLHDGDLLFSYRENDPETERYAFIWSLGADYIEIVYSIPGTSPDEAKTLVEKWPVSEDALMNWQSVLGGLAWQARLWIAENAEKMEDGVNE
jgi:hypothetical protein